VCVCVCVCVSVGGWVGGCQRLTVVTFLFFCFQMGFQREEALEGILIVGGDIGAAAELLASRRQQRLGPLRVLPG